MSFVVCVFVSKCSDNRLIVSDVMSRKKSQICWPSFLNVRIWLLYLSSLPLDKEFFEFRLETGSSLKHCVID